MKPAVTAALDDEPMPPLRVRRNVVLVLAFIAVLACAWTVWDRIAWHRFNAEVARLHAMGEPVWETDFARPAVPDKENAAFYLRRAAEERVETPEERSGVSDGFFEPPLSPEAIDAITVLVDANRSALADVRQAVRFNASDWGPRWSGYRVDSWIKAAQDLNRQRSLAELLSYAARRAHAMGDDQSAVAYIADLLAIGRDLDAKEFLNAHLVADGFSAIAEEDLNALAWNVKVGEFPGAARRSEINWLMAQLMDSADRHRRLWRTVRHGSSRVVCPATAEYVNEFRHITMQNDSEGRTPTFSLAPAGLDVAIDRIARPFYLLWAARGVRYYADTAAIQSGGKSPASPVPAGKELHVREMFGVNWVCKLQFGFDVSAAFWHDIAVTKDGENTALVLATRLYQLDHGGNSPATIAALVPTYLPTLPAWMAANAVPSLAPPTKPGSLAVPVSPTTLPATSQSSTPSTQ